MKDNGWRIDKNNPVTTYLSKTSQLGGSSLVKLPIRTSATLHDDKYDDKNGFTWPLFAESHPCENSHLYSVSIST